MRNFPCLTFQIFHIRIDAKVDDGERVFEWEHFFKLTLTKFDKIKFQKSWHQAMMLKQTVGGDVQLILEEIGFQYFPHTQRMLDKKFYLIEI